MNATVRPNSAVLVCQRGARHRYAVPRMLEGEGLLAGFYTDSTAYSPVGRLAERLGRMGFKFPQMDALRSRVPAGIPEEKIFSSDRPFFASLLNNRISPDLSASFIRQGLRGAGVLYNMYGEEPAFLEWAKRQGCKILVDVFVHPGFIRTVAEESAQYMESANGDRETIDRQNAHSASIFKLADVLLCPSTWVAGGVREMFPISAHKIRVVPYGSSLSRSPSVNYAPEAGRVLFAGREPLRKGLHYLAEATHLVRNAGTGIEVRVAGVSPEEIGWMRHADELNCLGTLPLDAMHEEFRKADVFVLPSLSEGQAGVILEAMACGCPVISTRESGVDFELGCGVEVPARNAGDLARAISQVVNDRARRNNLAEGALRQSEEFTMDAWKARLVGVITGL